jgi:hypothetical protein
MKRYLCHYLLLAFAIQSAMLFASGTEARDILNNEAPPYRSITPRVESTIENTATVALRRISQARADIRRNSWETARHEIDEAKRVLDSIRDTLSASTSKNLIRIARNHLEYEESAQILKELPRIYASLDRISTYLPTDKARNHLMLAKSYLEKNNKKDAARELSRADRSLVVIENEEPLLSSIYYLEKARKAALAKNIEKTDKELLSAEQLAMAIYSGMNSPLALAQRYIWLAYRSYSTSLNAEAKAYLTKAREYLAKSKAEENAKGKEEANKLLSEVSDLENRIGEKTERTESTFRSVLDKGEALAERSLAYLSAGISRAETTLGEENSLIEARLHLAYAESYELTANEPERASRELDTAHGYLQKAATNPLADPSDREKIQNIGKLLLGLKSIPQRDTILVKEQYDTINEGLNELIQKI